MSKNILFIYNNVHRTFPVSPNKLNIYPVPPYKTDHINTRSLRSNHISRFTNDNTKTQTEISHFLKSIFEWEVIIPQILLTEMTGKIQNQKLIWQTDEDQQEWIY